MIKFTFAVLLLGFVSSAFNLNNLDDFDDDNDSQEYDQSISSRELDSDIDDFLVFNEEFDDEFGEIEAIQGHVKYLDAARDTLLKFSSVLRKGKNVTNAFLKVIENFEIGVAEFYAALRQGTVKQKKYRVLKNSLKKVRKTEWKAQKSLEN